MPPPTPLRVLHLGAGRDWRGAERQLLLLAEGQRAGGVEPLVVAPRASALLRRARAQGLAAAAVTVRGTWDLAAARGLRRLLRTWRPDLVHAHDPRAHAVALMALLGRTTPLVVTRRSASAVPVQARLRYGGRVARFLVPTAAARLPLVRAGVSPELVEVIAPGVPEPVDRPPRQWRGAQGWPADSWVVGIIGLSGERATERVAAVVGALAAALGGESARLRVVRFGGTEAEGELVHDVPCLRAGLVDDLGAALAGLDLLLHLPAHDRIGMATLEAMAYGVPVIALPTGGLEELVHDGRDVVLVRERSWETLPDAIAAVTRGLLADPARRAALAAVGLATAAALPPARFVAATTAAYDAARRTPSGG